MPIGRAPGMPDNTVLYDDALVGENLLAGHAVALVNNAGQKRIFRCGATTYADQFIGFANGDALAGDLVAIIVGRGSRITPIVEGGGSLVVNRRVFLSATPGEVTQTKVTPGSGVFHITVGLSISTTELSLLTDAKALTP